jgi:hypothetical protein
VRDTLSRRAASLLVLALLAASCGDETCGPTNTRCTRVGDTCTSDLGPCVCESSLGNVWYCNAASCPPMILMDGIPRDPAKAGSTLCGSDDSDSGYRCITPENVWTHRLCPLAPPMVGFRYRTVS